MTMAGGRKIMFLFKKKMLAISLAALSIICVACNNSTTNESENNENYNNEISVNNTNLPDVNDDMAPSDEDKVEIKIGLAKNSASALGAAHLFANTEDNSAYEKYTPVVYNSYSELYDAFNSGEIYAAVLPPDLAALSNQNTNCYVAAVTSGCNYYIAENGTSISDITDLNGKTVTISKEDNVAESILNILADYNGINIAFNQVDTNAQLISGLKDGSISIALTQEPYLSQTTSSNVRSAVDLYDFWNDAIGSELVTSCLIVNKNFVAEQAIPFQFFMTDYAASAAITKRNTEDTATNANKFALVDDIDSSKAAVPGCGVTFKTGSEMKTMLVNYYNAIFSKNPDVLGGQMPDDNFYFVNE